MNSVILIGRLTRDPDLRYLQTGMAVSRFSLAVDKDLSKEKKQEFESKGQPTADFINIVVWGKQAENCANYLVKGRLVAIQGRIQTGSYTAEDGSKRYTTDVVAERVQFLEYKDKQSNQQSYQQSDFEVSGFRPTDDDDIPF
ncbi:Single-stranded DNA-binding protein 3 SSB 3 [Proteiniborus sp. DW1]|uniref:single-stranded DNA-binding protein n=1 Tax=Proteiniborus sp. DW1 TaxID=1889883 RepID=UPI00092DEE76|nr:single-stranded DNA-binding protein [Proteiniborus sp. DW1]SCG82703.1 Single-stranded DNA-binding protein 3 SSB 3 [Proteiniborus sp. DW1]